ncbi:unnamed protein product [Paramecium sonneborni]|uniref:Uncharacterized protein n=1 Tax=Paramecium sonneborni TaxID=65129 RepID=A0A8S1NC55_9CILI|nr:unnamed protein product [Paramecium sonneborni]CAD8088829.1 unnamed protein product [Paramecium sonneborni]
MINLDENSRLIFLQEIDQNSNNKPSQKQKNKKNGMKVVLDILNNFLCVLVYCFAFGNPKELGQPFDIDNSPFGAGTGKEEYKFAYFVNPDNDSSYIELYVSSS